MSDTIVTVLVHFENNADREVELLNPTSMIPKDLQRAALGLAEYQTYSFRNGSEKPRPTWAEVQGEREVEIEDAE